MKKTLFTRLGLALAFTFGTANLAVASHFLGGEVNYSCIAPGVYAVNCKLYRDCTGATAPTSISLKISSPGCNTGRTITVNRTGSPTMGNPYCSSIPQTCSTVRANHEEVNFATNITFTAAEQTCPNWVISTTNNARPELANLVNPQGDIYLEAYLNLNAGVNNNSLQFNAKAPTVEYVCVGQEAKVALTAYDQDCDSLSYELVAPMYALGANYVYKPVNLPANGIFINTEAGAPFCLSCSPPNPQYGNANGSPVSNFSPTFPIPSFNGNWASGLTIVPAQPYFKLDTLSGELTFRPVVYTSSPPVQGLNRYLLSVKVTEWRRIGGVMVKVGSSHREVIFNVEDCGGNLNPNLAAITVNGQTIQPGELITVRPNATLNMQVTSTDQAGDAVTMESNVTSILTGASFTKTTTGFPVGNITWAAPASNGTCGIRYFYVQVKDNACPLMGKKTYVFGVNVSKSGTPTGIREAASDLRFMAYPNPFSETVTFRFSAAEQTRKEIGIYNSLGQQIDRMVVPAGEKSAVWQHAGKFPAGTYMARLISAGKVVQPVKFIKL